MLDQQKIDEAALKAEKDLIYWQKLQAFLQEQEAGLTDEDRRIREECEGSLATFIQYMWKSIDPAKYIHNWHIDAICFPYSTKIVTKDGMKDIGWIVENGWIGKVLSWNHITNNHEWREIVTHFKNKNKEIINIHTSTCDILEATVNHPIFVKGKGYVRADKISKGDIVYKLRPLRKRILPQSERCKMLLKNMLWIFQIRNIFRKKYGKMQTVRKRFSQKPGPICRWILQHEVLGREQKEARKYDLSKMWEKEIMGWNPLQILLCGFKQKNKGSYLPSMQNRGEEKPRTNGSVFTKAWSILQSRMFWDIFSRREQLGIHRRIKSSGVHSRIWENKKKNIKERWKLLFYLQDKRKDGRSPYQQGQNEQFFLKSSDPVQILSQSSEGGDHAGYFDVIEEVVEYVDKKLRIQDTVYNIEVENNNNYFANNILVHNCEHLEAVVSGDIRHLLVNVSPRCMKSILASVSFTPWIWAQQEIGFRSGPQTSLMYASYGQKLSFEHSLKARTLIMSSIYQKLWGNRFQLSKDQNTITKFANDKGGYRMATSVGGTLTGTGGALIGVDDPSNTVETESEEIIQGVNDWWDTALSTRLNSFTEGSFFVIMQRLRQNDLSGHILEQNNGEWTHLCLPYEYESSRHCITSIGFSDPRATEGELMWPERIDEKALKTLKKKLGPFAVSGQLQQAPAPKGGGILKEEWFNPWTEAFFPPMEFVVCSCDTAYSEKQEADYSACVVLGVYRDNYDIPKIMIMYAWQERLGLNDLVKKISVTAKKYKADRVLIESKASGISVAQEIRRLFGNEVFGLTGINPKGDKVARVMAIEPLFAEGTIFIPFIKDKETGNLVPRDWADTLMNQVAQFPKGSSDDIVDGMSMGIAFLRNQGLIIRRADFLADKEAASIFTGAKQPLYDC